MERQLIDLMKEHVEVTDEQSLNIVLVDDDADELYLFNEALEHSGLHFNLTNALNGNQLNEYLLNSLSPDLIFLDINMPYKDGLESLKDIRNNPVFNNLRIVIYSTSKIHDMVKACYNAGADLFVVKPEDFDGMVKVVHKVCTKDWENFIRPAMNDGFVITAE